VLDPRNLDAVLSDAVSRPCIRHAHVGGKHRTQTPRKC
jgi:hypothetical protein